ncbi:ABC transporter permease [Verticiella sediminum]|uniref:ABC transporter permease n=1 Tax=Verticiella sediminum TaxID=1247510 RepID=A0A556AB40_9BURK|nr:ABC transporter permease [Verticiella sediminum]TSH90098.1 ABC transporter permease [Verticiella sediminum]
MKRTAIQITSVLTFFLLWKLYVTVFNVSALVLPPPEDVLFALVRMLQDSNTYYHIYTTLAECLGGFVIAVILGTTLGQLLGRIQILDTIFKPFVIALQLTPKVALIPLFILWFGFGIESKIVISALMAFFPVFANSYLGAKSVDIGLLEVFKVGNSGARQRFRLLVIPASLPYILTGMEMAIVLAIIGAVVSEFVAGSRGLGYLATVKLQDLEVDTLFAVVLLLAGIGFVLYFAVGSLRKILIPWHESAKSSSHVA